MSRRCPDSREVLPWVTMILDPDESRWRGTSDASATVLARAESTPLARLQWLEDALELAEASGALSAERRRRQQDADAWTPGPGAGTAH